MGIVAIESIEELVDSHKIEFISVRLMDSPHDLQGQKDQSQEN